MTATVSKYGWATAEDWGKHRETITDLYYHQNKKLREVKVIMEQEHHFFATDKMYKTHFTKWDIKKYSSRRGDRFESEFSYQRSHQTGQAEGGEPENQIPESANPSLGSRDNT